MHGQVLLWENLLPEKLNYQKILSNIIIQRYPKYNIYLISR